MHVFLDNFHQCVNYIAHIEIHQAELIIEETFTDKKDLSITSLQTDYLNIDTSSGSVRNNERENIVQKQCTFCGGTNHSTELLFERIREDKKKLRAAGGSDKQRTEQNTSKCF